MTFAADAEMESRCQTLVDSLKLPRRFSMQGVADAVGASQDIAIYLRPLPPEVGPYISGAVGLTPAGYTPPGYVISYPADADEFYQRMCLGHELGHILWHHLRRNGDLQRHQDQPAGDPADVARSTDVTRSPAQIAMLKELLPDLTDQIDAWSANKLFRCVLNGRENDDHPEAAAAEPATIEQQAELTGMLLVQRFERHGRLRPRITRPRTDPVRGRYADLLGPPHDRRR